MAKHAKPNCKVCRRHGEKLYLKGRRCESDKCPVDTRKRKSRMVGRGAPKPRRIKTSEYGLQLRERNKIKTYYGLLERQFRRYFAIAKKSRGVTGTLLLQLLERRLDNVVHKLNWAFSQRMAKQMVCSGCILVNNRRMDRPGYIVKLNDIIQIKGHSHYFKISMECLEERKDALIPTWLEYSKDSNAGKVVRFPAREETSIPIQEQLIVNFYSK